MFWTLPPVLTVERQTTGIVTVERSARGMVTILLVEAVDTSGLNSSRFPHLRIKAG